MESGSVLKGLFYGGFSSCVAETGVCLLPDLLPRPRGDARV